MADGEVACKICCYCAGDGVEILLCGHYLCGECSGELDLLPIVCPSCEENDTVFCKVLSSSEDIDSENKNAEESLVMEKPASTAPPLGIEMASVSSIEGSHSNCSLTSSMSIEDESNIERADNDSNAFRVVEGEDATSGKCKQNLYEGMIIAKSTLHRLNSALQMLKEVDARKKMLEKHIIHSVHEEFNKLFLALKKRKSDLLTKIKGRNEIYAVMLQSAVKDIEKQKDCLLTRIRFAEGVQQSPLVHVYYDLNLLVTDLQMKIQNESAIDCFKDSPDLRFNIDLGKMLSAIDNLGMVYTVDSATGQTTADKNMAFRRNPFLDISAEDRYAGGQPKDYAKGFYKPGTFDFGYMKRDEDVMDSKCQTAVKSPHTSPFQESSPILQKNNALLQSQSSPDVIIEEIIEEDQPCVVVPQNNQALDFNKLKPFKKEMADYRPKKVKGQKAMSACAPFFQKKSSQDLVYLSQLINPCNFYIHHFSQKRQIIMIERLLTTLSRTCSHCHPTDVLQLGEIVAFKSILHNKWCRGSIAELIPLECKCILKPCGPTSYKIEDITCLTLFLLDYGGSETFVAERFSGGFITKRDPAKICETKIDDLHKFLIKLSSADDDNIRFMPPFAIHCSLDLVPQSPGGLWTKEINDHFLKVVGKKCVTMKTLREEHNKLIVDLKKPFDSKIPSDMPMSLRDSLVFLEMAKFPSNTCTILSNPAIKCYKDPILPEISSEPIVVVCHMNDPSDFYIHLTGDEEYKNTVNRIQEVYNSRDTDDLQVQCPVVGQACVAKHEIDDDQWYRAEIMDLPNAEEAVIKYVDFGNISKVNVAGLRRLKEEFMTLPIKAIGCRLAYIQPLYTSGQWWCSEACKLFKILVRNKLLRCPSLGVLLERKLSVVLFDDSSSTVTSINNMLVERNVASFISCTSDSGDPILPLKEVWDPVLDLSPDSVEECMDNFSLMERKELDVLVSHVVSPSKIYVQWLTTQDMLKSLQGSLHDRYENSKPEPVNWMVNSQVAVQSDKKWMRGMVKEIMSDNLVQVFFQDFGMLEVTEVTNLRTLDESLMVYGTMCLECSLMDIQPAGGCDTWTATACDYVIRYLTEAVVTMIIEDNASVWPLPVKILIKNEAGKQVDVAESLVAKGLALRDRRIKKCRLETDDKSASISPKSGLQVENIASDSQSESTMMVQMEQSNTAVPEKPAMEPMVDEPYLSPLLPEEKTFSAKVSHVGDDGTIYVIQDCLENERGGLMLEIENSFKCLGLMAPYTWKKGEGCLIKGPDTMTYRGKVLDILGGDMVTVKYEDFGYTEKIPKCHLCPSVYAPHIPGLCIPCQLNDILPIGDCWQPDAIQFLRELLIERHVTVHIVEPPKYNHDIASVNIYCGNAPVADILTVYNYGIPKGCEKNNNLEADCIVKIPCEKIWKIDCQELLQDNLSTPLLPKYSPTLLPRPGELFEVCVTHFQTPNLAFIRIDNVSGDCNPLQSSLDEINSHLDVLPRITDFRTAMPCLALYIDGRMHRAKLQSIESYNPVTCLVQFVDYGSHKVVDTNSLFQLPPSLIMYPARAVKVRLAGFKPPKENHKNVRVPYCPSWSVKALYAMMDLVEGKKLFATCMAGSENAVFLYDDSQQLVHKQLIDMQLADIEEM